MWRRPLVTVLAFAPAVLIVFLAALKRWSAAQMFKTLCDIAFCIGVVLTVAATIAMFVLLAKLVAPLWMMSVKAFRILRFWPLSRMGLAKAGLLATIDPLLVAVPVAVPVYFGLTSAEAALDFIFVIGLAGYLYVYCDGELCEEAEYLALRFCLPSAMFARYRDEHEDVWSRETRREYVDWARRHIGDEFLQGDAK